MIDPRIPCTRDCLLRSDVCHAHCGAWALYVKARDADYHLREVAAKSKLEERGLRRYIHEYQKRAKGR